MTDAAHETPAWAYERVHVEDADPSWSAIARELAGEVAAALGADPTAVEHIGSTSVPGLAAKPVIDLELEVDGLDEAGLRAAPALAVAGWAFVPPDIDPMPWRRFFVRPTADGQRRLGHLHLIERGDPEFARQLAFRDALRADPALRDEYAALKRTLASAHPDDRSAYTDGKSAFVARVLGEGRER